jgi:thiamine-monophosphate kinase
MTQGGEFDLIRRHFARASRDPDVALSIGDDAAVVRVAPDMELVLAVDMMVEGRHFFAGTDAEGLGHKILAVNLSDIAAMGARPRWALLAGALPSIDDDWLASFSRGLFTLAQRHGVTLIGGDTTRGPRTLSLTSAGEVPRGRALTRAGARVGDDVWVSGTLGDAMLAVRALEGAVPLDAGAQASVRLRLERPTPRVELGQRLRGLATAMIDVSDGLTGDLGHVLASSRVGARIALDAVPRSAVLALCLAGSHADVALACLLAGGDDYELCFTADAAARIDVGRVAEASAVAVSRIGSITREAGLVVHDRAGRPLASLPRSFDHFG